MRSLLLTLENLGTEVNVLDIPRAFTALAEWLACVVFAIPMKKRMPRRQFIPLAAAWLVLQTVFLVVTDDLPLYLWTPCMAVAVAGMLGLLMLLCDMDLAAGIYTCFRAFILAEFAAALEWELHCFLWPEDTFLWWQRYGLLAAVYGGVYTLSGLMEWRLREREVRFTVTGRELMSLVAMGVAVFAVSNLSFYYLGTPFSGHYTSEIMNIRTLVDASGVALMYAYHFQLMETRTRKELMAMQAILESQYAQYTMSRDSMEVINRRYHDLKHQIIALRAEKDLDQRNRWLDEMEAELRTFEAQNKTGNSVLDTLLTGKSLQCQKYDIAMTVVADGKSLSFMDVMDICTIFGNALDNAIEYERKLEDKTKRMIHLTLTVQKQFLLLQVENYCPSAPEFREDGLPATTKKDKANHGFGLKSIRLTAGKYDGTTTVRTENDWFVLKVLLPLPAQAGRGK